MRRQRNSIQNNIFYIMLLSRIKSSVEQKSHSNTKSGTDKNVIPDLEQFLKNRDYTGAITLLKYKKSTQDEIISDLWTGYCYFHLGDYSTALEVYSNLLSLKSKVDISNLHLYCACCTFLLGRYQSCQDHLAKSTIKNSLRTRIELHLAHKNGDESTLHTFTQQLEDVLQDQLCLASIHYLRSHYQEAIDIYKKILLEHRDFLALNVYVALCYYKLDYYDVSQEVIAVYLQHYPDSVTAINLKACNHYRLYNGKAAEAELRSLIDIASPSFTFAKDLIRHNLVVFRNGEGAMQVLPGLIDIIPEARLNLVIHYLKQDCVQEAFDLIKDLEPSVPHEYILKGVVNAAYGQEKGSRDHLKFAQQFFQLIGGSASECDTIPGRQCMASCFFLMKQFDDVLLYLSSIKSYFYNDDSFNFNYGQAKAATGNYAEAEEAFLTIKNEKILNDPDFISWMIRCYIMNKKPEKAWKLYESMSNTPEAFNYLTLIANDCYKMGQFVYSLKAFDAMEKTDPDPEYWEGKRGASIGIFQSIIAEKEPKESLQLIYECLRNSDNQQAEEIVKLIKNWEKENKNVMNVM